MDQIREEPVSEPTHIGLVHVPSYHVLEMLDFEGGSIVSASVAPDGDLTFKIIHPDLPETVSGGYIQEIIPCYTEYTSMF